MQLGARTRPRPISEQLFESYLDSQDLRWEYEPDFGSKRPDYLLTDSAGQCVVEVEELLCPNPVPTVGYSPVDAIRQAMRRGRKQLKGCKHLPASIALYSEAPYRSVTPVNVACAAFGPGYRDLRNYQKIEPWSPALRFSRRSELPSHLKRLANAFLSPTANRTVSAVIVVMRYQLSDFWLAVWKRLYERQMAGETLPPAASLAVAAELRDSVPRTFRFEGTIRTVILENPHCRIPFSHVFQGPFDQRWGWNGEWCLPI